MFRTEVTPKIQSNFFIDYTTNILSLGSCFATTIGSEIEKNKFVISVNPFGVLFNPLSITTILKCCMEETIPEELFIEKGGVWNHFYCHSCFSGMKKEELENNIKHVFTQTKQFVEKVDTLFLTLGTAIGYIHKKTGLFVANCHKQSSSLFEKKMLSVAEIEQQLLLLLSLLPKKTKIVLTLSPVRHVKDTLESNLVSKSRLRVAMDDFTSKHDRVTYFSAYELLQDDLRDYRFYSDDLLHPSEKAIAYVWDKFVSCFMNQETQTTLHTVTRLVKACQHKPFHVASKEHQEFLRKTLKELKQVKKIDFSYEIRSLENQLT
ncbi:MAG: GSCFA domain-containing protein [Cyclobacteriaceae bacterium]